MPQEVSAEREGDLRSKSGKRFGQVAPLFKEWRVWGIRQQSPIGSSRRSDHPLRTKLPSGPLA